MQMESTPLEWSNIQMHVMHSPTQADVRQRQERARNPGMQDAERHPPPDLAPGPGQRPPLAAAGYPQPQMPLPAVHHYLPGPSALLGPAPCGGR